MRLSEHDTLVGAFAAMFDEARLVQTHISSVVITSERVYKFKKPVDFGFLNYMSLSQRKHFCEEEIRLGQKGAPELYIGVVALYGTLERPTLDVAGEPIEYAVCMERFDEEKQLDNLLASGRLAREQIDLIAHKVAAFHRNAERVLVQTSYGTPEIVLHPMLENIEHLDALLGAEDTATIQTLQRWIVQEHARLSPLMLKRRAEGFVRECHGDLHLRNMALHNGGIIFFDPIEFNESLRHIDTISDLAFLLMDLEARGHLEYARRLLSLYLEESGDYEAVALLPLYKVYRAMVRAKVAALQLQQRDDASEKATIAEESRAYLRLACSFLKKPKPFLAIMHGFSGSGKSVAALEIVEQTGAIRLRSDRERLRLFSDRDGRYSADASEQTYRYLAQLAGMLVGEGERVVVDATFLQRWQRDIFYRLRQELDAALFIIPMEIAEAVLFERVAARGQEKGDISEATVEVLRKQLLNNEPLQSDEAKFAVPQQRGSLERLAAEMESRMA